MRARAPQASASAQHWTPPTNHRTRLLNTHHTPRAGADPYELINQGVAAAARLSGTSKALADKELPPSLDLFGWCTWDAFYSTVSARGLQEGLQSFAEGGVQPRLLIIDDGWQVRGAAGLRSRAAALPGGLRRQRVAWPSAASCAAQAPSPPNNAALTKLTRRTTNTPPPPQMTEVDEPFRKAPTGQLADQVAEQLPKSELASELAGELNELLDTTEAAFYQGSASVLAESASLMPPSGGTPSGAQRLTARRLRRGAVVACCWWRARPAARPLVR
jgi:hypothetical protein